MDSDTSESQPASPLASSKAAEASVDTTKITTMPVERRHAKVRARDAIASSNRELVRLLMQEERETKQLQQQLYGANQQLQNEKHRADDAERRVVDIVLRLKESNDARTVAQQDCARLDEELKLYKIALENAQKEIFRAQEVLNSIEEKRHEAEAEAAKARSKARKLTEEKLIGLAREEGTRLGVQEGIERGRDIGFLQGRAAGYAQGRATAERFINKFLSSQRDGIMRDSYFTSRSPSPDEQDARVIPPPLSSEDSSSSPSMRPIPARNPTCSPLSASVEIFQDSGIPEANESSDIWLPPPHALSDSHATGRTRSRVSMASSASSPPLPPLPIDTEEPILMVPPPQIQGEWIADGPPVDVSRPPVRRRRRSSASESGASTRTSELELLRAPEHLAAFRPRESVLSVIPEVASAHGTPNQIPAGMVQPDVEHPIPTPRSASHSVGPEARSSPNLSASGRAFDVAMTPEEQREQRGSTSTQSSVPNITVLPPSRPASNNSQNSLTHDDMLSPADADRPVSFPGATVSPEAEDAPTPSMVPLPPTGSTAPISLPSSQLPPGFVPNGPPIPLFTPERNWNTVSVAGVPLPPSTVGSHHYRLPSVGNFTGSTAPRMLPGDWNYAETHGSDAGEPAVIPARHVPLDSDSVSSSSTDTLTTPPGRKLRTARSSSGLYHHPGSARTPASQISAYNVPLPPSTVAGTPYTSYSRMTDDRHWHINAGATPAATNYPISPSSDRSGRTRT